MASKSLLPNFLLGPRQEKGWIPAAAPSTGYFALEGATCAPFIL